MNERETQPGEVETVECFVCGKPFVTQAELLMHLEYAHTDGVLLDPAET